MIRGLTNRLVELALDGWSSNVKVKAKISEAIDGLDSMLNERT